MKHFLPILALALGLAAPAFAQSTATPVLPGSLQTSGCPAGSTYCYAPYSNSNPLPVSASFTPSGTQNVNLTQIVGAAPSITNPIWTANAEAADTTGSLTAASQTVANSSADGYGTGLISIHGTYTGSGSFVVSDDSGVTFYPVLCARTDGTASETGFTSLSSTTRMWVCPVSGNDTLAVQSTGSWTGSASVRVGISAPSPNSGVVAGTVGVSNLPTTVDANSGAAGASTLRVVPSSGVSTDASGTIATGGSFQTVFAASATRKGCLIQNPTTATEIISVKVGTMANPFTIPVGGTFSCAAGAFVISDAITATAATTSHAFAAVSQ